MWWDNLAIQFCFVLKPLLNFYLHALFTIFINWSWILNMGEKNNIFNLFNKKSIFLFQVPQYVQQQHF